MSDKLMFVLIMVTKGTQCHMLQSTWTQHPKTCISHRYQKCLLLRISITLMKHNNMCDKHICTAISITNIKIHWIWYELFLVSMWMSIGDLSGKCMIMIKQLQSWYLWVMILKNNISNLYKYTITHSMLHLSCQWLY